MALTPQQQQSVNDSGGYYDATGNWVDLSSSPGANQGATAPTGPGTASQLAPLASLAPLILNMLKSSSQPNPGALLGTIPGGQDLLNGVVGQQQQQAPLRQAVTQQAMNMLPNSAFPGGRTALSPVGPGPGAVPTTPGTNWGAVLGTGTGLGALATPAILALLKKLLGGSPAAVPANPTAPGGPTAPNDSGPSVPGLGGNSGGFNNDLTSPWAYLKGNPNAQLIDPIVGGAFSGGGTQEYQPGQSGGHQPQAN